MLEMFKIFFITEATSEGNALSANGKVRKGILYHSSKGTNTREISILRMRVYSKVRTKDCVKMSICGGLVKTKKTPFSKDVYVLGINIYSKQNLIKQIEALMIEQGKFYALATAKIVSTAILHQKTFAEFRNKHENQTVTLIGAGPTVSYFTPVKNSFYVGLNRSYIYDAVHFDYLFAIDKAGLDTVKESYYEGFLKYDCIKFVGDQNGGKEYQIPQSFGNGDPSVRRFRTTSGFLPDQIAVDIDTSPLAVMWSISIAAMQFILFTNPKRIYVVGIDCTVSGGKHFSGSAFDVSTRNENPSKTDSGSKQGWARLRNFIEIYYPETEIISVNPVGLKGMFRDVYTREYLKEHPEIDASTVEILNTENP